MNTKIISIRIDEDEIKILDRKVGVLGIDRSAYFKMLIREGEIRASLQTNTSESLQTNTGGNVLQANTRKKPILERGDVKRSKVTKGKSEVSSGVGKEYLEEAEKIINNPNNNPNYISFE